MLGFEVIGLALENLLINQKGFVFEALEFVNASECEGFKHKFPFAFSWRKLTKNNLTTSKSGVDSPMGGARDKVSEAGEWGGLEQVS